jgi:hypothetical protein
MSLSIGISIGHCSCCSVQTFKSSSPPPAGAVRALAAFKGLDIAADAASNANAEVHTLDGPFYVRCHQFHSGHRAAKKTNLLKHALSLLKVPETL